MSLKNSNSLLLALPRAELDWLEAKFSPISLSARDQLYEQGELMSRVFFPTSAVISLASVVEEGGIAEVATVGNEGVLGVPIFLGIDLAVARSTVTVAGDALVMPAETFKEALSMSEALRRHVARYLYALLLQITR